MECDAYILYIFVYIWSQINKGANNVYETDITAIISSYTNPIPHFVSQTSVLVSIGL